MTLDRLSDEYRYAYLSPEELRRRLEQKAILYLPIGSLEWHNEHLPLGTDTLHAIEICSRLSQSIGGVVLPGFWWNTSACHDTFCTYHMPEDRYVSTLKSVCLGLSPIPAHLLVLVNGHGGDFQIKCIERVTEELNGEGFPMRVVMADPYRLGKSSPVRIDHADTGETSFSLELIPQLVRLDRAIGKDIISGKTPFEGTGEPTQAGGRQLWEAYFADACALIEGEYRQASR